MNVKSQSELDIGGRETCYITNYQFPNNSKKKDLYLAVKNWAGGPRSGDRSDGG